MRADRLISIMLLLQTRGQMTAQDLAEELEVSERTIYRDIQALSAAGVPIYAEHGPGGGLALLDSYRTNLTGLNEDELRALFVLSSVPEPLNRLGIGRDLKSAFTKLSAALPVPYTNQETIQQRFLLDWDWWQHSNIPVPYLSVIRQAIWEDRRLHLAHQTFLLYTVQADADPYALVAKAGAWFLIASVEGGMRVYEVSRLSEATPLDEHFQRSQDFNLANFWEGWRKEYEESQRGFPARIRVSPELLRFLPLYIGRQVTELTAHADPPDAAGWVTLTLYFESLEAARDRVLSMGGAAEVLDPQALRMTVIDHARQTLARYPLTL